MSSHYIHGDTDAREVARLEKQARWVAPWSLEGFDARPGDRVLDLATGVGAMAGQLLQRFPGIRLTGLDLRAAQLQQAKLHHPGPDYLQGNGARMPFADGTFDRVHCSWLLEHVPAPVEVLREVRRVLKPGGFCQFVEVDNATFGTEPEYAEVRQAFEALNEAQQRADGDPFIGRRLGELFHEAGFAAIEAAPVPLRGDASDPVFFQAFIDEFAEIFESTDEALGPAWTETMHAAAARLRGLTAIRGGSIRYAAVVARGFR
jgi:ubiquinone/menaquinone biosynthesis C-methylase UbiE